MSIASRIEAIEEHIENAYDSIEALGVDITDVNKNIENISTSIDGIYDTLPKVTGEGESITLDGTIKGRLKTTLKGNTSQDGTPTPSSPIPVNVVSGDNSVSICGKNLIPFTNQDFTLNGVRFYVQNGSLYMNGTSTSETLTTHQQFKNNFSFILKAGTYYFYRGSALTTLSVATTIKKYDDNTNLRENNGTFTLTEDTKVYLGFYLYNKTFNNIKAEIMLNKGNTQETYEPYTGATYLINLPEGMELCKIPNTDYEDTFIHDKTLDKWYWHREVGEVVLDGSENWGVWNTGSSIYFGALLDGYIQYNNSQETDIRGISNYFAISANSPYQSQGIGLRQMGDTLKRIYCAIDNTTVNSLNDFKNWLSSHNTNLYYVLETPTNTEITYQPLIEQLNNLEKAMSCNGQTNISQVNNDLPFIISTSALKEWVE